MTNVTIQDIFFKRGNEASLPSLRSGEPAITEDTGKLFVGTPTGNVELAKRTDMDTELTTMQRIPVSQHFTASLGQTVFPLDNTYTPGVGMVSVELDGVPQILHEGFSESSENDITLTEGTEDGAIVRVTLYKAPNDVNSIGDKADKAYVDIQDNALSSRIDDKADTDTVNTALGLKANQSDLDDTNASLAENAKVKIIVTKPPAPLEAVKYDGTDQSSKINAIIDAYTQTNQYTIETIGNGTEVIGGGVILEFPSGICTISNPITLKSSVEIELNNTIINYTGTGDAFNNAIIPGTYDQNGIFIRGFGSCFIKGNNSGRYGINFLQVIDSEVSNITVYGFTSDGIHLEDCQWLNFEKIISSGNGGYGVSVVHKPSGYSSNNNVFKRCKFETNVLGGARIGASTMNAFYGCTFQFNNNGYGVYATGETYGSHGNAFDGCHFEGNKYHVYIDDEQVINAVFNQCFFCSDTTVVNKFIYNCGWNTILQNCSCLSTNLQKINGTNAPYMNSATKGYMVLQNCYTPNSADAFACYDNGTNITAASHPRIYITTWNYNSIDFYGSLAFDGYGATNHNYLKSGSKYIWPDANGRLRTSSTLPTTDSSGTAIQYVAFGGTAQRPTKPNQGEFYFDGNINKPIWCKTSAILDASGNVTTSAVWVDSTGTIA